MGRTEDQKTSHLVSAG